MVGGTSTTATLTIDAGAGEPNGDTFDGVIGGSADGDNLALEVASGTLTLTGANSYSGATTVDEGATLQIGDGDATGSLGAGAVTDIGSLVFDCGGDTAVNNPISGTGSLTQEGAFTVTLDGGNSYSGGTEIDAGNLAFGSTAAIGTGNASGNITVNDGGALDVPGPYTTVTQWLAGGTINTGSNGALALTGDSSESIDMTGYDSLSLGAATDYSYYGVLSNPDNNTCIFGGGGATLTIPNALGDVDDVQTNVVIQGDVTFAATNTYSGTTTVSAARCRSEMAARPDASGRAAVTDNATLSYDRSDNINIGYAISGTGSVAQDGSDTLTLSGSNGYSGGTEIDTGNLAFGSTAAIGGGTGNANVTINQAGALNVSGPYTTVMGWLGSGGIDPVPQAHSR